MNNKSLCSFVALTAIVFQFVSCRVVDETAVECSEDEGRPMEIVAVLDSASTRTSLASDGLSVTWNADDKIGVYSDRSLFVVAGEKFTNTECGLYSGAGQKTAVFKVGSGWLQPKYAYYPYNADAGTSYTSVSMNLPSEQSQRGEVANTSLYDVKVGTFAEDLSDMSLFNSEGRFVFTFKQMLSLLYIEFTPSSELTGDKLRYIRLEDQGSVLAGDYTINLTNSYIAFASGASSSLTLSYPETPVLEEGKKVKGWLFSNAGIKSGDHLVFSIRTDNHIIKVNVDSKVTLKKGMRYTLPLDVASLVASGKAEVEDYDRLRDITVPGVYDGLSPVFVCEDGVAQYAACGTSEYRIQNFNDGEALVINLSGSLEKGSAATLSLVSYGDTGVATAPVTATVIDNDGTTVWFREQSGRGYILSLDI